MLGRFCVKLSHHVLDVDLGRDLDHRLDKLPVGLAPHHLGLVHEVAGGGGPGGGGQPGGPHAQPAAGKRGRHPAGRLRPAEAGGQRRPAEAGGRRHPGGLRPALGLLGLLGLLVGGRRRLLEGQQLEAVVHDEQHEGPHEDDAPDGHVRHPGARRGEEADAEEGHGGVRQALREVAPADPHGVDVDGEPRGPDLVAEGVQEHVHHVHGDAAQAADDDLRHGHQRHAGGRDEGGHHEVHRLPEGPGQRRAEDPLARQRQQHDQAQHLASGHEEARDGGALAPHLPPEEGHEGEVLADGHRRDEVRDHDAPALELHLPGLLRPHVLELQRMSADMPVKAGLHGGLHCPLRLDRLDHLVQPDRVHHVLRYARHGRPHPSTTARGPGVDGAPGRAGVCAPPHGAVRAGAGHSDAGPCDAGPR
mmetsp:Transcript_77812/g.241707  ORF Transcript_77812/g.241707 Transcript_77812/m.241707 type:complete len:418 (+) Transcript_77812:310-1563(+)